MQPLEAYQIAFDLYQEATQEFLLKTTNALSEKSNEIEKIKEILSGKTSRSLHLLFLSKNNAADGLILKQTRSTLESRSTALHSAISIANGFTNAGTTSDTFLRNNMEWLSRASNWTKFTATAALGVLHFGNVDKGMTVLEPYLPKEGVSGSAYSEGLLFLIKVEPCLHLDWFKQEVET